MLFAGPPVPATGMQTAVTHAMAARQGTAVVLDVASGKVLAAHRLDVAGRILVRPGSTVKPFVLMAAADRAQKVLCRKSVWLGGRNLNCSHADPAQPLGGTEALAYSCNFFFAGLALRFREGELEAALRRAIPTTPTRLSPNEATGSIDVARSPEERQLLALGEARIQVTPLAMLAAYRKLALERGPPAVVAGLEAAAQYGTARLAQPPGLRVAGKTGTSTEPGDNRRHAWFIGYAPADAPAIAVMVFIDQGRGGADAAPAAREIFAAYQTPRGEQVTVRRRWLEHPDGAPVRMQMEDYVAAVLAGECGGYRSEESLKAMAVAARTYAVSNRGRHAAEGFDLCDTTHCQDFREVAIKPRFRGAAEATRGEVVWYQGSAATIYYHADCAGSTEASEDVWSGTRLPYLRRHADGFCVDHGPREWRAEIRKEDVARALSKNGLQAPADLRDISVLSRTASGRAGILELIGAGRRLLAATAFRFAVGRTLGWDLIRSTWFQVEDAGDQLVFTGRGNGHGVGMCQTGAARMGEEGHTYREILDFYFPGTTVGVGARGFTWQALSGERVELLTTRPAQDRRLASTADRLARNAEALTGFVFRDRPQVRVFPTVDAFRDATAEPGWVAASTRGNVVRIQPLQANFDATLLHELLHLLIATRAHPALPLWFREGLVLYLADPSREAGPDRVEDRDFEQARSRPAMAKVYEASRSRVRRLIDHHSRAAVLGWVSSGLPAAR